MGDADPTASSEPKSQPAEQPLVLQRRVRSMLLETLRAWRIGRFECCAIEGALQCIQRKIVKFEESVEEIRAAAAGKAWLSIKEVVDEMLQRGASHTDSKQCPDTSLRRPNQRQSGVFGVIWQSKNWFWHVRWRDAETGKMRSSSFAIEKFLQQGLDEEAAIEVQADSKRPTSGRELLKCAIDQGEAKLCAGEPTQARVQKHSNHGFPDYPLYAAPYPKAPPEFKLMGELRLIRETTYWR